MTQSNKPPEAVVRQKVDDAADRLANRLGGPLLTMYYPEQDSLILPDDIRVLYRHLRQHGLSPENPLPGLNVALHTTGGDANTSYRIAQLLRDFATNIKFIVPEYAYSGGTTITLAGDEIALAHYAVLSPIDVGLSPLDETESDDEDERLELIAVDHYIAMTAKAKAEIENALRNYGVFGAASAADKALMVAMVDNPENAMRIGTYYRQRNIAEKYARQLLSNYMLKNAPQSEIDKVINGLITEAPSHDFDLDYHLCSEIGLVVSEANQALSDLSKELVDALQRATEANVICHRDPDALPERRPFFHYISPPSLTTK